MQLWSRRVEFLICCNLVVQMMYGRTESWRGDRCERPHNHGYGDPRRTLPVSLGVQLLWDQFFLPTVDM